jgi:hypothetical protein
MPRVLLALMSGLVGAGCVTLGTPPPETARSGPSAVALARHVEELVGIRAWRATGAIQWRLASGARHLWDKRRNFDRQELKDGTTIWINLGTKRGRVARDGAPITGPEAEALLARAYARWANDSFWLNPLAKLFDEGVELSRIDRLPDQPDAMGLLVEYKQGGVTPGDRYLWVVPGRGPPRAWRMWVSILPIGGLEASWEGWVKTKTGAWISTAHRLLFITLRIHELETAARVETLAGGADPFAGL